MAVPGPSVSRPRHRLGRYLITGRLGRGGMGQVYRAYDESLDREVAVKTLTAEGPLDPESLQRFEIEARAAARLQHANILTVYELGEERGLKFIAMELLGGSDLEAALHAEEPLLLEEKLEIAVQVCRGLAYAHQRGIVHRDMKPSNVRVLDDGTAKIMDFGIAKLAGTNVTKSGMMVGTVHYMSPEQIRGAELDGRSDVFSMGVILHELLSGRRPFPGDEPTAVLYKIVHAEPEPLEGDLGAVGPRLREILARALAKDVGQRHPPPTGWPTSWPVGAGRAAGRPRAQPAPRRGRGPARRPAAAARGAPRGRRGPPGTGPRGPARLAGPAAGAAQRRGARSLRLRRAGAADGEEYPSWTPRSRPPRPLDPAAAGAAHRARSPAVRARPAPRAAGLAAGRRGRRGGAGAGRGRRAGPAGPGRATSGSRCAASLAEPRCCSTAATRGS